MCLFGAGLQALTAIVACRAVELLNHVGLPSAFARLSTQQRWIKLTSDKSMAIEGAFVSSACQVIDEQVGLVDPCKLTIA